MSLDADVIVAGGGPVGLAAAIEARLRGLSVVVVEPRTGAIDKACGEGLMPSALDQLQALGVAPVGRPFVGIRYVRDGLAVAAPFRRGPGLGVRRTALHAALGDRADAVGVDRLVGSVRTVTQDAAGVSAAGVRARWLLGADGLHSAVRRDVGLSAPPPRSRAGARYGLRCHFDVPPWTDHVEVHWSANAEAYVTPVDDCLVGVAVLGSAPVDFDQTLDELPALRARLRGAAAVTSLRGAGPLRQRTGGVRNGRVLLIGDAAGYVDALTGEGLAVGVASARAAVAALAGNRLSAYDRDWARATRRYRLLTGTLLAVASRPRSRSALVPVAVRFPALFARAIDLLA